MIFRRLGNSGLQVSVIGLGGWLTFGGTVQGDPVKEIIKIAFEAGINYFDTAEVYSAGKSETEMGRVFKELGIRRSDLVLSTKIFFGNAGRNGPNDRGLSRKHIIEGLCDSLERLQTDYVDIVFAHRADPNVPMLEIVRAFSWLIEQGKAFYWATSMWSVEQIEEAHQIAEKYNLHAPIADQVRYSALAREHVEKDLLPVFEKYNYGTTVWSPLAGSLLTGKYNHGQIPPDSRLAKHSSLDFVQKQVESLKGESGKATIEKVKKLLEIGRREFGEEVTTAQVALAWAAKTKNVATLIVGASKPEQLVENLGAIKLIPKLTEEVYEEISKLFS
ncbi:Aldo/keto reductase [Cantharellus anzutake]|uniref:Aldo/keto reductase n=1 Tax=Cantharellus anzutake TaxID=1750568 RepID=UPI0019050F1D|nr:Aldo/keto reductase [Cantharellus anzutake]KAF8325211.1 Aldo/keto reductase [Cantharellus anzutake]